jgi:hypothetical protein
VRRLSRISVPVDDIRRFFPITAAYVPKALRAQHGKIASLNYAIFHQD